MPVTEQDCFGLIAAFPEKITLNIQGETMKRLLLMVTAGLVFGSAAYAGTGAVQIASFNHSGLSPSAQCIRCHKRDQPDDDRHRQTQANCSTCHNTDSWKPATIETQK
jgi:hypothetical protein